jgi:predicted secreted protein
MALRSFLATLLCASALAACSTTQASEPLGATCDQFRTTPIFEQSDVIAAGADVKVVLCSNPSTGFSWDEPQLGDSSVLQLVDRTYQAPDGASLPIVGAAGDEVLTVRGLAAGTTTLSIRYSQPWAGGTKGVWTYRLSVTGPIRQCGSALFHDRSWTARWARRLRPVAEFAGRVGRRRGAAGTGAGHRYAPVLELRNQAVGASVNRLETLGL